MKRTTVTIAFLALTVAVLVEVIAFTAASPASAQLGNTGVPVKCEKTNLPQNSGMQDIPCTAADGTAFVNGSMVPAGQYLLVTDLIVQPYGPLTGDWLVWFDQCTSTCGTSLEIETQARVTTAQHFVTPYFVLPAGARLQAADYMNSSGVVSVRALGILTTNVNYVPLIRR